MTEQKIVLTRKQFSVLYKQVKEKLIAEYKLAGIKINESLKSALWTHYQMDLSTDPFLKYILKKCVADEKLHKDIDELDPLTLYRISREFDKLAVLQECKIKKCHLKIFSRFLGFKNYEEFFNHAPVEKVETADSDLDQAMTVIDNFYEHLIFRRFSEAWELISPSFKARVWNSELDRFADGYQNFRGIKNKHVFNATRKSKSVIDCMVYYEDDLEINIINEINQVESMIVKDIDQFTAVVKKLSEDVTKGGGKDFGKVMIQKLFDPAASEYIWYKCGFDHAVFEELYPAKKGIMVRRLYICSCILHDNKWYIERIFMGKSFSSR